MTIARLQISKDVSSLELPKVLVIYTGGTIGMTVDINDPEGGLKPAKNKLKDYCLTNVTFNDMTYTEMTEDLRQSYLVLPSINSRAKQVIYYIYEYDRLVDSSNVTPAHWTLIASDIEANYSDFDGFVVIHGTDTMSYTASALSFIITCTTKSIVMTGAQSPIFDVSSDGKNNLSNAISIAGNFRVPEVCVFFYDRLLRGNRSVKISSSNDFAFDSPNALPLLLVGSPPCDKYLSSSTKKRCKIKIHRKMNTNVSVLKIFPGMSSQEIKRCLGPPYEGVVLESYGNGNVPTDRSELLNAIKMAADKGIIVVNCTQCSHGTVMPTHATGKVLTNLGVIGGNDMTIQAAITKLMYVLSEKKLSLEEKKNLMRRNIKGEMTLVHS